MRIWHHVATRVRALSPRAILVIGFALFLLYAFPGYMSNDSVQQLLEARAGLFSDGHPPLMAAEWWVLDRIVSGPILMLLLQGTLFLGGLYVLFQRLLAPRAAAWAAIGIFLFPPVLATMSVIWKDSQMAAYLVAGTAALVQPRLRTRVLGLVLLGVACVMRHNAFAAVAPLVAFLFQWRTQLPWWKRLALLGLAAVLAIGALLGVSRVLAREHVRITPAFYDIAGILAFSDDKSDEELRYVLRGTTLAFQDHIQDRAKRVFAMRGIYHVAGGPDRLFDPPRTDADWAALYRAWKELALSEPGAYFASHWDRFVAIIGMTDEPLRAPVWNLFLESPDQIRGALHSASWSKAQELISLHAFYWLADDTPLFRPYMWALAALILLVLCCRERLPAALITSGILYELSFFPAFAEPDYRYSHWMVTSCVIAIVIMFIQRRRAA